MAANRKIGAGAGMAAARMGLDEIGHALKAFPDSIPITPEAGALGEPTPQQVYQEQGGYLELQQSKIQVPQQQQEMGREP